VCVAGNIVCARGAKVVNTPLKYINLVDCAIELLGCRFTDLESTEEIQSIYCAKYMPLVH
jgi:hypothetical protein